MSYHWDFVPEGCSLAQPAATLGVSLYMFRKYTRLLIREHSSHWQAGVQWAEAYEFADTHNITLVGGVLICPAWLYVRRITTSLQGAIELSALSEDGYK
jgi:hypothetical protein